MFCIFHQKELVSVQTLYFDFENFPMTARVNADTTARMGDQVKFIMDMEKAHIFDKETGIVITN